MLYKTLSNEAMACGYRGLLSRVLPESRDRGTRGKLLTLSHFSFYPSELKAESGISCFFAKKICVPSLLSAKQTLEWVGGGGVEVQSLPLRYDMQRYSIWHLGVTESEGGPRVALRLSGEGATQARTSGMAYDPPCGSSCTGAAGNREVYT